MGYCQGRIAEIKGQHLGKVFPIIIKENEYIMQQQDF